jgi:hypothetical protein
LVYNHQTFDLLILESTLRRTLQLRVLGVTCTAGFHVLLLTLGLLRGSSYGACVELLTSVSLGYYNGSSNINLKIFN